MLEWLENVPCIKVANTKQRREKKYKKFVNVQAK